MPAVDQDSYIELDDADPFQRVVEILSENIFDHVDKPCPLKELKDGSHKNELHSLVMHLAMRVGNKTIIHALLCIRWHLNSVNLPADDQRALLETRSQVCEVIAARVVMRLSDLDAMEYCLYQLPAPALPTANDDTELEETSALLSQTYQAGPAADRPQHFDHRPDWNNGEAQNCIITCAGLTALEIAVVAEAKYFLSREKVEDIVHGMWYGSITFKETESEHSPRVPKLYNKATDGIVTRLKVPRYVKSFEVLFYLSLFLLCCFVAYQGQRKEITPMEVLLYAWLASLILDEINKRIEEGSLFFAVDMWNTFDQAIICLGLASFAARLVGLKMENTRVTNLAFDLISIEALFVLPRMFSFLTLYPSVGILFPCLNKMAHEFAKFMFISFILFSGFFASFTFLCYPNMSAKETWWLLTKVYFGESGLGIDKMASMPSPLAEPLMLLFVVCSRILMMTVIICVLHDTYVKVIASAHDECVYLYTVFILEASTASRHAYFYPPLDLVPLVLVSPFQLCLSQKRLEGLRYVLLIVTHLPIMICIWIFETVSQTSTNEASSLGRRTSNPKPQRTGTIYKALDLVKSHLEQAAQDRGKGRRNKRTPKQSGRREYGVEIV